MEEIIASLDFKREIRYCIYRHKVPINRKNLHEAELIARVKPLSGWNLNGRNIDRPIDEFIAKRDYLPTGHWNPFRNAKIDGEFGKDCLIDRLAVEEGKPLPRRRGLYVHTVQAPGISYYAVLTCINGVENTRDFSHENSTLQPVVEKPAEPLPVFQKELPRQPFFNYEEQRLHFVRWVGPPYSNLPYKYYNWSVGVPTSFKGKIPLELSLPRDGHSYWRTQYRIERDSLVLTPYDFPQNSWWYGYHESLGTLRSFREGSIKLYTERRLLSFIRWACCKWPVDKNRILVTGCMGGASGSGALHLALRHPDTFSLVVAGHPIIDYRRIAESADRRHLQLSLSMQAVWGQPQWELKTEKGENVWEEQNMLKLLGKTPTEKLPFMAITSQHTDEDTKLFYKELLNKCAGFVAHFEWGGTRYIPVSRTGTFPNVLRLEIAKDRAILGFRTKKAMQLVEEGRMGNINLYFRWREIVDRPDRFEFLVYRKSRAEKKADIAIHHPKNFKILIGRKYFWRNFSLSGKKKIQEGEASDRNEGFLLLPQVEIEEGGNRIVVFCRKSNP